MLSSASRSRGLPQICAACARRIAGLSNTTPSTALRAPTPTTTTTRRATRISTLPPSHTRFFSSTSPASSKPPLEGGQTQNKPLPYYALFPQTLPDGPPPAGPFDIDVRALRREFLQLQAASHPDFHHAASSSSTETSASRRQAEALSSHINAAYKTLSSPLLRAQYILAERYGYDLAGDEASSLTGPPDPELLSNVLEARETIEEAESESDLEQGKEENDDRIRESLNKLAEAFAQEDVETAVRETVRLRYWENIRESIHNWEPGKPVVLQH